jgi:hypothetical protein
MSKSNFYIFGIKNKQVFDNKALVIKTTHVGYLHNLFYMKHNYSLTENNPYYIG